jgi:2-polyprenyl-3-methyl-5-hydroxy-6-metoxy-1,4-benzoquinol methylase
MSLESVKCNLCGGDEARVLIDDDSIKTVECKNCGLIYLNPRTSLEETLRRIKDDGVVQEHIEQVWHYSKTSIFSRILSCLDRFLPVKGSLLDVGCGYGMFLDMARKRGWDTKGLDLSRAACNYARQNLGLNVSNTTLSQSGLPDNTFEAVTELEVLNLQHDPCQELGNVYRILKPGGIIYLRLNNAVFHIFVHRILTGLKKVGLHLQISPTVFHLYTFSPATITRMLEKTGFEQIRVYISEPTSGDPYGSGRVLPVIAVVIAKKAVFLMSLLFYYLSFKTIVLSSSMMVSARKPKS